MHIHWITHHVEQRVVESCPKEQMKYSGKSMVLRFPYDRYLISEGAGSTCG